MIRFELKVQSSHGHSLTRLRANQDHSGRSSASMPHMDRHRELVCISVVDFLALPQLCLRQFACNTLGSAAS